MNDPNKALSTVREDVSQFQEAAENLHQKTSTVLAEVSRSVESQLSRLKKTVADLESELAKTRNQVADKDKELTTVKNQRSDLLQKVRELEVEVGDARDAEKKLQDENKKLRDEVTKLRDKLRSVGQQ